MTNIAHLSLSIPDVPYQPHGNSPAGRPRYARVSFMTHSNIRLQVFSSDNAIYTISGQTRTSLRWTLCPDRLVLRFFLIENNIPHDAPVEKIKDESPDREPEVVAPKHISNFVVKVDRRKSLRVAPFDSVMIFSMRPTPASHETYPFRSFAAFLARTALPASTTKLSTRACTGSLSVIGRGRKSLLAIFRTPALLSCGRLI